MRRSRATIASCTRPRREARRRAIALDPSDVGHQVTLGQVLLLSGDAAEAHRVAKRARATARTATERETVERLLAATLGAVERPN